MYMYSIYIPKCTHVPTIISFDKLHYNRWRHIYDLSDR